MGLCQNSHPVSYFPTEGDDLRTENPLKAIEMFEKVVDLETKLGDQVKWLGSSLVKAHAHVVDI